MCDTMVALGNSTRSGQVLIAKNSDRHPNEPHIIIKRPRQHYSPRSVVHCTYIDVEQAADTYEVLLLKPSWIWGCEMGANEFGLNIGNEAVFTREPVAHSGLTGMDMIRLALERCKTSSEALECITDLLARYGQGGNCGYGRRFLYHNSFILADPASAWVLETAGEYWAAAQVQDIGSISNRLTLGKDFDRCHPNLISHAVEKGWCRSAKDFDFAGCYTNKLITRFSGSKERWTSSKQQLAAQRGKIDEAYLMQILRSHHPKDDGVGVFAGPSVRSICMHGGGLVGDHTTGSYIGALEKDGCTYWVTGSSTPCISVFKPLWLDAELSMPFTEADINDALEFWYKREELHRQINGGKIPQLNEYLKQRNTLEADWLNTSSSLTPAQDNIIPRRNLMARAWEEEMQLITATLEHTDNRAYPKGRPYYRNYWRKQNRNLQGERQNPRIHGC